MSYRVILCHTVLYCIALCCTVSYMLCVIPCHTVSYRVILCCTALYCVVPRRTMSYHVILCHTLSYCVIPCHTVSYHVILCHTVSYCVTWSLLSEYAALLSCVIPNITIYAPQSNAKSYRATLQVCILRHEKPYRIIACQTIHYSVILCHTVPCCTYYMHMLCHNL